MYVAKNYRDGTALEKRANTFMNAAALEPNEAPARASDRGFMVATAQRAQAILKKDIATRRPSNMPHSKHKPQMIDPSDPLHEAVARAFLTTDALLAALPPKTKPLSSATTPAPSRTDFATDEDWEEALARWRSTVGRNKAIAERALLDFRQKSGSTDK